MNKNSRLVYSTDNGRIKTNDSPAARSAGDGVVRIKRETKGRKGKGVSLITGVDMDDKALKALAKELKQKSGAGGSIKEGVIEIQTDDREKLKALLEAKGLTVKLAGG